MLSSGVNKGAHDLSVIYFDSTFINLLLRYDSIRCVTMRGSVGNDAVRRRVEFLRSLEESNFDNE